METVETNLESRSSGTALEVYRLTAYYEHAGIAIYHGDCREILERLPVADICLTDPPYGIGRSGGFHATTNSAGRPFGGRRGGEPINVRQYPDTWDAARPDAETFRRILLRSRQAIIWGGNFFADLLPRATHWLVWDKLQTMPTFSDCEIAWTTSERTSVKKITVEWNGLLGKEERRDHPTQKPLELMRQCLLRYGAGGLVLDPFMGSGTTLVAAKALQYRGIGIEIEEKYCEIAALRLRQEILNFPPPQQRREESLPLFP